jgi:DNA-binding XRE family transcriptional regulator
MAKPIEPVYRAVGAKIEELRSALGWTQEDLAKRIGLNRTSIVNIEAGRQRILLHDAHKIAAAFGVTVKHLMKGIWW